MPAIFVSHSTRDHQVANEIMSALKSRGFDHVFLDFDKDNGIGSGEDWEKRLYEEVSRCHAIILVLTPHWIASKWCFAELSMARARGKVVLPVICSPLCGSYVLPGIQAVDLVNWDRGGFERIEQRLQAIIDELARGFTLDPHRSPYPGIHAFEAEDAPIYFGRDEETRSVIERLEARRSHGGARLLVIIGASGAGKSSLLKAGVLPQLARRRGEWILLPTLRPEKTPLEALAKSMSDLCEPQGWRVWHQRLRSPEAIGHVAELVRDLRTGVRRSATLLLPVDQLEEVFTIAEPEERAAFLSLTSLILDPERDLPVIAVATGRADVLQGLLEASELAPLTESIPLLPMPLERVPRLVEGPAVVAALNIESGLSDRIMRDVESPEALPLLAYTLRLLHERSGADKRLTLATYSLLGDPRNGLNPVQNSVRLAADRAITGLRPSPRELAALRDAFVPHLARLRLDDGRRVRQPAPLASLPREAGRLIRALIEARLLAARIVDGEAVVEVAHEALFDAWPTLRDWLDEEQAFLADIERVKAAQQTWIQAPNELKPQALLQGLLLSRAQDWLIKYPERFQGRDIEPLRTIIEASIAAEAERKAVERRRMEAEQQLKHDAAETAKRLADEELLRSKTADQLAIAIGPDGGRDLRLNFLSGLALVLLFIEHIPDNVLGYLTVDSLQLYGSTDIFIFISAYTVYISYSRLLDTAGPLFTIAQIERRAFQLYVVYIFIFVILIAEVSYAVTTFNNPIYNDEMRIGNFFDEPNIAIVKALLLEFQPALLDILPLYIVMLVIFPVILFGLRRSPALILLLSFLVYLIVQFSGLTMAAYPEGRVWSFNPLAWQFLFVTGAALGCGGERKWWTPGVARAVLPVSVVMVAFGFILKVSWIIRTIWEPFPVGIFNNILRSADNNNLAPFRLVTFFASIVVMMSLVPSEARFLRSRVLRPLIISGQQPLEILALGIFLSAFGHFVLTEYSADLRTQLAVNIFGILAMCISAKFIAWYKPKNLGAFASQ